MSARSRTHLPADGLPPLPYVAHEILLATLDERSDAGRLADLLRTEPGMAARVVAAANAAWFARRAAATDLRDAVVRLGLTRLRVLVTGLLVGPAFDTNRCPEFDAAVFWQRAVAGGFAAGQLTQVPPWQAHRGPGELATLLRRIGLLLLAHSLPEATGVALAEHRRQPQRSLAACLRAATGSTVVDVSVLLLREWDLPATIVQAVEQAGRRRPVPPHGLADLVRTADAWVASDFETAPESLAALAPERRARLATACRREWDNLSAMAGLLAG